MCWKMARSQCNAAFQEMLFAVSVGVPDGWVVQKATCSSCCNRRRSPTPVCTPGESICIRDGCLPLSKHGTFLKSVVCQHIEPTPQASSRISGHGLQGRGADVSIWFPCPVGLAIR